MFCILGASGFIGRSMADHLASIDEPYCALLREPHEVPPGAFPKAKRVQAFEIGHEMDLRAFDGVKTVLVAAWATKPNVRDNGIVNEVQKNILPHSQLLAELPKTDVEHLIFLSSGGAVYGNVDQRDRVNEDHLCVPCTAYGYGKLCIEKAIQGMWATQGRRYTILRPSNPVGRHQMLSLGMHGLFPSVTNALITGAPVPVFGDGTTVRDYFAVEDLAELIMAAATQDKGNQIVNASSGIGLSINDVIDICAQATGIRPNINYDPAKQPVIEYNVLDNSRAGSVFGWSANRPIFDVAQDLDQALRRRVEPQKHGS